LPTADLAADPRKLQELRQKIIGRRDILFRDLTTVRALESYLLSTHVTRQRRHQ
jgi:hypothetical protein